MAFLMRFTVLIPEQKDLERKNFGTFISVDFQQN